MVGVRQRALDDGCSYLTANCIIIAIIIHLSCCFQGQLCKIAPAQSHFRYRKMGDHYAIRSRYTC
jgi:hypothetical protein